MLKTIKRWISLTLSAVLVSSLPLFGGIFLPKALATAPVVNTDNISVMSLATGTNNTFKIGDTVTGRFDDSGNPDPAATTVTINFSEFGGGAVLATETPPGSRIWEANHVIVSGVIDVIDADISVSATNTDGTTPPVTDTENHSVDNVAPLASGNGVIDVVNNNEVDNSTVGIDDKVSFGVGTLDVSDGETWTVNLASPFDLTGESALASGNTSLPAIENNLTGSKRFPVTGTDNAGNTTTITNGTNSKAVDTLRPTLVSAATETTNSILVDFSETINSSSVSTGDFAISNPVRPVVTASRIANTRVRLQTTSAFSPSAIPTITITDDGGAGIYDANGNEVNIGSSIVASDGVKPQVGPDVEDLTFTEGKNDREENLAVTFSEAIPTAGSTGDYTVIYDADGDFLTSGDQRNVAVASVSNLDNNQVVDLTIADQSGNLDYGGRFQVTVNTSNVRDASGNGVDTYANVAQSDAVSVFDSYTPALLTAGLDPSSGLYKVGSTITVYVTTDDAANDQSLSTLSGTINGKNLTFTYDAGDDRYEAGYTVAEGDADATGLEALSIQLRDLAGHASNILSTSGNSLSIDANTPAIPSVSDPVSAEIINAGSRTISGTADIGSVITVYTDPNNDGDKSDGVVVGSGTATGGSFAISVPLVQNVDNNFLATSTDTAGNESAPSDVATITEDSTLPVVSVNLPNGGELFAAGGSVTVTWALATDANLSATPISIYYSQDGGSYNLIASNEINDGSYIWTTPDINSGQVLIKVTASDEAGNVGEDVSDAVFAIDNSLPTSQVDVFLQGQAYGPNTWDVAPTNGKISGTAADSPAGVAGVSVTIVDPNGLYWNDTGWAGAVASVSASGVTSWSYALDKSNLVANNGVYAIYSRATDTLGNTESTGTGSFVWDNQNPTASIINPNVNTKWRQGNRTITWSASDSHFSAQPIKLEYEIDGGGWNEIVAATENDGSYVWSVPTGTNTNAAQVRLTATDSAGNSTAVTSPIFTIDSTQPNVAITAPASGLVKGSVTLSASADDPTPPTTPAGINYVRFSYRLVGGSWSNLSPQINSAPYNYDWDTTSVADGSYEIRATATDLAGNSRTSIAPYAVITVDNTAPVITVLGDNPFTLEVGSSYSDPGATASDIHDGDLTSSISSGGSVDTSVLGANTITYDVTDLAGNTAIQAVRTVDVVDTEKPVITLNGTDPVTVEVHGAYSEDGATVNDNYDAGLTATITGTVDTSTVGSYTLYYDATDSSSNSAIQVTRTVDVVDTTDPSKPVASPDGGNYASSQSVQLSSTDNYSADVNVEIYYTTDNTNPDQTSTLYTSPITISVDTVIKAVAYDEAGNESEILTASYGIAPVITGETSSEVTTTTALVSWTTDHPATSRVVYDTVSHPTLGSAPNYGYPNSTIEDPAMVTSHSVLITGLSAGTKYYFRTISHGSPETVSQEGSFSTITLTTSTPTPTPVASSTSTPSTTTGIVLTSSEVIEETTPAPAVVAISSPTPTPEASVSPEVKGAETEEAQNKGMAWWPLLIPIALVVIVGAAVPLSAATAMGAPIIGAAAALIIAGFTQGDVRSAYIYLIIGGETVILLLVNYGLLSRRSDGEIEEVIKDDEKAGKKAGRNKKRK